MPREIMGGNRGRWWSLEYSWFGGSSRRNNGRRRRIGVLRGGRGVGGGGRRGRRWWSCEDHGWWRWRSRRWWWWFQRVQSDAAAWGGVLSGRKRGVGCDEFFADWNSGGEAGLQYEPFWCELYRIAVDTGASKGQHEAVHLSERDGSAEYDTNEFVWDGADTGAPRWRLRRAYARRKR